MITTVELREWAGITGTDAATVAALDWSVDTANALRGPSLRAHGGPVARGGHDRGAHTSSPRLQASRLSGGREWVRGFRARTHRAVGFRH